MIRRLVGTYLVLAAILLIALVIPLGLTFADNQRGDLSARVERDAFTLASLSRDSVANPGHFHEYTALELVSVARRAGWEPLSVKTANYFRPAGGFGRLYGVVGRTLPPGLRHGITVCLERR